MKNEKIDFKKGGGLVPAIVQDKRTGRVLMLGYMNKESLERTVITGKVVFYSRKRKRLWTKGEESGNYLIPENINTDCDGDTLLIMAVPTGPVCHKGTDTCFNHDGSNGLFFLSYLEKLIRSRKLDHDNNGYTASLFRQGINRIAQKVGEEAVELVIESRGTDISTFRNEAADLLFHFLVLLSAKGSDLNDIVEVLKKRHIPE